VQTETEEADINSLTIITYDWTLCGIFCIWLDACRGENYLRLNILMATSRLLFKSARIGMYKTTILHIILYGNNTWSLTLKEEHRLRVFGNNVL
jgi:hypothetical protein